MEMALGGQDAVRPRSNCGSSDTLASAIQGMDNNVLETLCQRMFNSPVDRLSSTQASNFIDTLRSLKKGTITLERLLSVGGTNEF